jgi:hypothetical protein
MTSQIRTPKNPFRAKVDAASVAVVAAEQLERKALDAFLLADSARSQLLRRMSAADEVHTSQGAFVLDRTTGRPIDEGELSRADRHRDDAESEYVAAARSASGARGQLHAVQKAAENAERNAEYWAGQSAAEAALTPAERDVRARRDAQQAALVAR